MSNLAFKFRFGVRRVIKIIALLALGSFSVSSFAGQCLVGQVKEVGSWVNPDANTRGITKVVFGEECRDASTSTCSGNICTKTSAVKLVYTAKVWGKCSPSDCYWGKVDGSYTSAKWLKFYYDQGFAKRLVWGQIKADNNNLLDLVVETDFVDASRADYTFRAWMKRQ